MTRTELAQIITNAAKTSFGGEVPKAQVDYAREGFGDFATNLPFQLAKQMGKPPGDIAAELAAAIQHPQVARAEPAGGGYVNLTMTPSYWAEQLSQIGPRYGANDSGQGQKVQVEFISANPTGPLTIANARGGFLGDVICNVLAATGANVTREYYINDAGTQIGKLVKSLQAEAGLPIEGERQYQGEYLADLLKEVDPREYKNPEQLRQDTVAAMLKLIKASIEGLVIAFDEWTSEAELVASGESEKVLEAFRAKGLVYEQDGAIWLKSAELGDERDRVLIRSSGEPTYTLNDLAYHYLIFTQRGFNRAVKIWGADHAGQTASLSLMTKQLVPQAQIDFVLMQFVRLMRAGVEVKMSKRAGVYVTVDELVEAVGSADVARWFLLSLSPNSKIEFDLDLAREKSSKNPYYYVMYAYARANSILAKASDKDLAVATELKNPNDKETALIRQMTKLPELVSDMVADYGVHRLTFYGLELAKLFQDYYETERIIDLPAERAGDKLYLVQQFVTFMNNYWNLLGIEPLKRMEHPAEY